VQPTGVSDPRLAITAQGSPALADTPADVPSRAASRVLLDEPFMDNRMGWPDDSRSTAWVSGPGYRLVPRRPGQFVAVSAPIPVPLEDVVLTATFRKLGGPPGGGYGLIVRHQHTSAGDGVAQDGRFYVLEVGDRGEIGIWRRDDDHWTELLSWTLSPAVHQGSEANTLEVWATGQRLTLFVNGMQVASRTDTALPVGGVGVFAGGDGNDVQLDRLMVRVPSQAGATSAENDVGAGGEIGQQQQPSAANSRQPSTPASSATPSLFQPITRVAIPSIALDAPSVPAGLIERDGAITWDVPRFKIGHAQGTAGAGAAGNAVLVGHVTSRNLGNVFEHLQQVRLGDTVQVFSEEQRFEYRVVDARSVARKDVSVVETTAAPSLTLITCTGPWLPLVNDYAERLAVRAVLASPEHSALEAVAAN
jgi:LPXTG-site transpeptidase (sortase) family protein